MLLPADERMILMSGHPWWREALCDYTSLTNSVERPKSVGHVRFLTNALLDGAGGVYIYYIYIYMTSVKQNLAINLKKAYLNYFMKLASRDRA